MPNLPNYSFSAHISGTSSTGMITRFDGQEVEIGEEDIHNLLKDLSSGPPQRKWHMAVLGEWFDRKRSGQNLRLVVG